MAPETPNEPAPRVVITISAPSAEVAVGSPLKFLVWAAPAPSANLTVGVKIRSSGCELAQAPNSVTVPAGKKEATLTVPTSGARVKAKGCTVTATIAAGAGYQVGAATAASASASLTPETATPESGTPTQRVVTIAATAPAVTEGSEVSFTLTAAPPPASALTVTVSWDESGSFLTGTRRQTVTIPTTGTATLTAATADDATDERDGSVTVTVEAGTGYTVGSSGSATVDVRDNDPAAPGGGGTPGGGGSPAPTTPSGPPVTVTVSASAVSINEGESVTFVLTASSAPGSDLTVSVKVVVNDVILNDYPEDVEIKAGSNSGIAKLQTVNDDKPPYSGNGSVTLTIKRGNGYEPGGKFRLTVTVVDNDT